MGIEAHNENLSPRQGKQPNHQLHSFPSSQAAAGAVEKATIELMVAKLPNSSAVQMKKAFMDTSPKAELLMLTIEG